MAFSKEIDELVKSYMTEEGMPHEYRIFSSELELKICESGFVSKVSETWTTDPHSKFIGFYNYRSSQRSELQKVFNGFLATVSPELPSEIHEWSTKDSSLVCRFAVYSDSDRKFITGHLYFAGV